MSDEEFNEAVKKSQEQKHAEICELAYKKWQDAGEPHGNGTDFWLEAENEWNKNRLLDERWQPIEEDEDGGYPPIRPSSHLFTTNSEDAIQKVTKEEVTLLNRFYKWLGGS